MAAVDRERFLNNIGTDAARLNHPVSRLLDPARADMAETAHDVATAVIDAARCVADAFNGDGFGVDLDLPDSLPRVAVPAAVIETAFTGLLENSRQAGASHAILAAPPVPGAVTATVCDDGPGIPVGDRERVFEPFVTSRRATGGTGLGLRSPDRCCRRMAGRSCSSKAKAGELCS